MGRIVNTAAIKTSFKNRACYTSNNIWIANPASGTDLVRVSLFGPGANGGVCFSGAAGGYAQKSTQLSQGSFNITVAPATTSSFGSVVSATAASGACSPGCGIGGDVNRTGGLGYCGFQVNQKVCGGRCCQSNINQPASHDPYHGGHNPCCHISVSTNDICLCKTFPGGGSGGFGSVGADSCSGGAGGSYLGMCITPIIFKDASGCGLCGSFCYCQSALCFQCCRTITNCTVNCVLNIVPAQSFQCLGGCAITAYNNGNFCFAYCNLTSYAQTFDDSCPYTNYTLHNNYMQPPTMGSNCCYEGFWGSPGGLQTNHPQATHCGYYFYNCCFLGHKGSGGGGTMTYHCIGLACCSAIGSHHQSVNCTFATATNCCCFSSSNGGAGVVIVEW